MAHYVRLFLRERGIASESFAIAAEAEPTPDESRLARIDVWIDLGRTTLDEAGRAALLVQAERCKIHNTLKAACPVSLAIGRKEPADAPPATKRGGCA